MSACVARGPLANLNTKQHCFDLSLHCFIVPVVVVVHTTGYVERVHWKGWN